MHNIHVIVIGRIQPGLDRHLQPLADGFPVIGPVIGHNDGALARIYHAAPVG